MRFSLFFFLNVIAILILLIVQPHASAEDDEWYIEDFGGFIVKEKVYLFLWLETVMLLIGPTIQKVNLQKIKNMQKKTN
jgi:hypothetical protein